jgi:hypothetical protein
MYIEYYNLYILFASLARDNPVKTEHQDNPAAQVTKEIVDLWEHQECKATPDQW